LRHIHHYCFVLPSSAVAFRADTFHRFISPTRPEMSVCARSRNLHSETQVLWTKGHARSAADLHERTGDPHEAAATGKRRCCSSRSCSTHRSLPFLAQKQSRRGGDRDWDAVRTCSGRRPRDLETEQYRICDFGAQEVSNSVSSFTKR
jgi:hypothetical protein